MNDVKIEDKGLIESLSKIDDEDEVKAMMLKALSKGASVLQSYTKALYKSYMPTADTKMIKGIKKKVDKAYTEVMVTLMGDYRNKWFEKGTQERHKKSNQIDHYWGKKAVFKKNGSSTGRIKGKYFFRDSQNAKDKEIQDTMNKTLEDEMRKIQ